jgi:hypothetical protein
LGGDKIGLFIDFFEAVARLTQESVADAPPEQLTPEEKRAQREAFLDRLQRPKRKTRNLIQDKAKSTRTETKEVSPAQEPTSGEAALPEQHEPPAPAFTAEALVALCVYTVRP